MESSSCEDESNPDTPETTTDTSTGENVSRDAKDCLENKEKCCTDSGDKIKSAKIKYIMMCSHFDHSLFLTCKATVIEVSVCLGLNCWLSCPDTVKYIKAGTAVLCPFFLFEYCGFFLLKCFC